MSVARWSVRAEGPCPPVAWLLRAQWVKFMVMSGTVKVGFGGIAVLEIEATNMFAIPV